MNGQRRPIEGKTGNGKHGNGERDVVLSVRGISVAFGDKQILENLDLDVYRGEILGFVGASGVGKSVLMRTILGLIRKHRNILMLEAVISAMLDVHDPEGVAAILREQADQLEAYG